MAESRELEELYLEGNGAVLLAPTVEAVAENFPKYVARSVVVDQNGIKQDYDSWLEAIKGLKTGGLKIDVRSRKLMTGPRTVGVFQHAYITPPGTDGLWVDSICYIEYGAKGTEDEKKIVKLLEVIEMPKDRAPDAHTDASVPA